MMSKVLGPLIKRMHPQKPRKFTSNTRFSYDKYATEAQTGDVLLFCATDPASKLIRVVTKGSFQHVAIVIKGAIPGEDASDKRVTKVRVLQATSSSDEVDYLEHYGKEGSEVMVLDLETLARTEETIVVRQLECDDAAMRAAVEKKILQCAKDNLGKPYTLGSPNVADVLMLVEALVLPSFMAHMDWFNRKHFDTYVCSTMVAHTLMKGGVLNSEKHPLGSDTHFFPCSFDQEHLSAQDDFMPRARLGNEMKVENPWDASKVRF
jgi:hypothetical protein